jgi:hypothetical protein
MYTNLINIKLIYVMSTILSMYFVEMCRVGNLDKAKILYKNIYNKNDYLSCDACDKIFTFTSYEKNISNDIFFEILKFIFPICHGNVKINKYVEALYFFSCTNNVNSLKYLLDHINNLTIDNINNALWYSCVHHSLDVMHFFWNTFRETEFIIIFMEGTFKKIFDKISTNSNYLKSLVWLSDILGYKLKYKKNKLISYIKMKNYENIIDLYNDDNYLSIIKSFNKN